MSIFAKVFKKCNSIVEVKKCVEENFVFVFFCLFTFFFFFFSYDGTVWNSFGFRSIIIKRNEKKRKIFVYTLYTYMYIYLLTSGSREGKKFGWLVLIIDNNNNNNTKIY